MGRHYKEVSAALAMFSAIFARQREMEERAARLSDDDRRVLFRNWAARANEAQAAGRYVPSFPQYLRGLACGAIKKNGKPCGMTTLGANGRCKFHGGASTGPRTPEGRAKALENLKLGRLKRGKS
ncbi:HGGxSTG domain-containing protein [Novosphingobium umbonatum]|uniref:HGGxSTG domain-containing protein n=1 Tax=Novosphingobium umbonatum TaxID=1908524 RepID=UPI001C704552|nr:HGGxSTG domain-containing protein [Novosphingobium umbonatum]